MNAHFATAILIGLAVVSQTDDVRAQQGTTPAGSSAALFSARSTVALDLLPTAVQATLHQYARGSRIVDIQEGTIDGQPVYQAILEHDGQRLPLQVARNGGLVPSAVNDQFFASVGALPGPAPARPEVPAVLAVPDWRTAPARTPLANLEAVSFQSLPPVVRRTFLSYSGGSEIGSVQQGKLGDRTVYEAQLRPAGQEIALRVAADGALINDQVNDRFRAQLASARSGTAAVGQPALSESATASGRSADAPHFAPLNGATAIPFDRLPAAVRTTLEAQTNPSSIDLISQGELGGKTFYDATLYRAGQRIMLRVAQDGSVLGSQAALP
jgi:hypothetical protein